MRALLIPILMLAAPLAGCSEDDPTGEADSASEQTGEQESDDTEGPTPDVDGPEAAPAAETKTV